eukprot:12287833-Alexandrium_andersonii.AAC.1
MASATCDNEYGVCATGPGSGLRAASNRTNCLGTPGPCRPASNTDTHALTMRNRPDLACARLCLADFHHASHADT